MQTVSKKIVQSRTNSTLVGVFSIILVFISAFVNMVRSKLSLNKLSASANFVRHCLKSCCFTFMQFACDTTGLAECVAEKLNTSAVTPCLIRSLNVSVEGGLEICPSRGPSCPFPEVSKRSTRFKRRVSDLHLCFPDTYRRWCVLVTPLPPVCVSISATACCWRCWPAPCSCRSAA